MSLLSKFSIRTKMILGFGIIFILIGFSGVISLIAIQRLAHLTDMMYKHPLTVSNEVRKINTNINALHRIMKDVILAKNLDEIKLLKQAAGEREKEIHRSFEIVQERFLGEKVDVHSAYEAFNDSFKIRKKVLELKMAGHDQAAQDYIHEHGEKQASLILKNTKGLLDFAANKANEFDQEAKETREDILLRVSIIYFFNIAMFIAVGFYLIRSITKPIQELSETATSLSKGNLSIRAKTDRSDEFGDLAKSFNSMADTIQSWTESKLKESEEKYRNVVENIHEGIWTIDEEGITTFANESLAKMLKYETSELIGRHVFSFLDDENLEKFKERLSIRKKGIAEKYEIQIMQKDGNVITALVNAAPLFSDKGKVIGSIAGVVDITEEKKNEEKMKALEEKLYQAKKMESIGRLAGGIAHDFNNILTAIQGFSELALDSLDADSPIASDVKEISKASDYAADLTQQLLAFSRKQIISPQVIDLNKVISNSKNMLKRIIEEKIEVNFMSQNDLWYVKLDVSQVDQILINLCINARDAMPEGGHIFIETENKLLEKAGTSDSKNLPPGSYVKLSLRDTGHGMDEKTLERIFEPFFSTKEQGKGTGLGLATIYGIIKQNRGHIFVESKIDKGTTFEIYFPAVSEEIAEDVHAPLGIELMGKGKILLVEDQEILRDLTERILKAYGYDVVKASNGEEALNIFKAGGNDYDLLLTDVIMPKMSGKLLFEKIREVKPEISVLYMSGYTGESLDHDGFLEEGLELLSKPFKPHELARKIKEVLYG